MMKEYEKYLLPILKISLVLICILAIYFFFTNLIFLILPFLLGWLISIAIQPLLKFFNERLKFPRGLAALVSLLIFVLFTISILFFIGGMIVIQLIELSSNLTQYSNEFYMEVQRIIRYGQNFYISLPQNVAEGILNSISSILENLTSFISVFIASLLNFISAIPSFLVFLIVTIISAFFMAKDKKMIQEFVLAQFKSSWLSKFKIVKQDLLLALVGYIKAQLTLMTFTFTESIIGLSIIGVDYGFLLALLASLLDALPVLGTGSVYVPLMIWNIIKGDYSTAIYIGILYGMIVLIRQLLEPKILGNQIGLYPLSTLASMYIGLKIFGVLGLILGPITLIVIITLQKVDVLPRWKTR